MTSLDTGDDKKDTTFNVDCRGTIIKTKISYLDRIDLLRTMVDLSNQNYTIFLDYSPNTYHEYLDYLRDREFKLETAIPKSIERLYNYLGTDCLQRNKLLVEQKEKEKEKEKKEIYKYIEREVVEWETKFDYNTEFKNDPRTIFKFSLKLPKQFYDDYKIEIDKLIKEKRKYRDVTKYCDIRYLNCDEDLYIFVWNDSSINIENRFLQKYINDNNDFCKCTLCTK